MQGNAGEMTCAPHVARIWENLAKDTKDGWLHVAVWWFVVYVHSQEKGSKLQFLCKAALTLKGGCWEVMPRLVHV
eukprot:c36272_g1_i1 orf=192-416(+)